MALELVVTDAQCSQLSGYPLVTPSLAAKPSEDYFSRRRFYLHVRMIKMEFSLASYFGSEEPRHIMIANML
jgi:hypothetical protein